MILPGPTAQHRRDKPRARLRFGPARGAARCSKRPGRAGGKELLRAPAQLITHRHGAPKENRPRGGTEPPIALNVAHPGLLPFPSEGTGGRPLPTYRTAPR